MPRPKLSTNSARHTVQVGPASRAGPTKCTPSGLSSFELGVAFEKWRCLHWPRAGGARASALHTRSKTSSPLGLPQRNAGLPTNRRCAGLQTGLPPGQARMGSSLKWGARVVQKPASTGTSPDGEGLGHRLVHLRQCQHPQHARFPAETITNLLTVDHPVIDADGELHSQSCSDWPEPPFLNWTRH